MLPKDVTRSAHRLDLSYLKTALLKAPTIPHLFKDEVDSLLVEYKRYLCLKVIFFDTSWPMNLPPSEIIDQVWRTHAQLPADYARCCQQLGVDFIKIGPKVKQTSRQAQSKRLEETKSRYEIFFPTLPFSIFWEDNFYFDELSRMKEKKGVDTRAVSIDMKKEVKQAKQSGQFLDVQTSTAGDIGQESGGVEDPSRKYCDNSDYESSEGSDIMYIDSGASDNMDEDSNNSDYMLKDSERNKECKWKDGKCVRLNCPLQHIEDSGGRKENTKLSVRLKNECKNEDCYLYINSKCSKGTNCLYRHQPATLTNETVCKFWKAGKCVRLNCAFRHIDNEANKAKRKTPNMVSQSSKKTRTDDKSIVDVNQNSTDLSKISKPSNSDVPQWMSLPPLLSVPPPSSNMEQLLSPKTNVSKMVPLLPHSSSNEFEFIPPLPPPSNELQVKPPLPPLPLSNEPPSNNMAKVLPPVPPPYSNTPPFLASFVPFSTYAPQFLDISLPPPANNVSHFLAPLPPPSTDVTQVSTPLPPPSTDVTQVSTPLPPATTDLPTYRNLDERLQGKELLIFQENVNKSFNINDYYEDIVASPEPVHKKNVQMDKGGSKCTMEFVNNIHNEVLVLAERHKKKMEDGAKS